MSSLVFLLLFFLFFLIIVAFQCYADNNDGELWCVAKNNAEDSALQSAIDWACGPGGADCTPIQPGGPCFDPQDLQSHASWAFNDYFVRNGFQLSACDFSGTAAVISLNPSRDKCIFPSSSSARNGSISGSSTDSIPGTMDSLNGATSPHLLKNWLSTLVLSMVILTTTHSPLL